MRANSKRGLVIRRFNADGEQDYSVLAQSPFQSLVVNGFSALVDVNGGVVFCLEGGRLEVGRENFEVWHTVAGRGTDAGIAEQERRKNRPKSALVLMLRMLRGEKV